HALKRVNVATADDVRLFKTTIQLLPVYSIEAHGVNNTSVGVYHTNALPPIAAIRVNASHGVENGKPFLRQFSPESWQNRIYYLAANAAKVPFPRVGQPNITLGYRVHFRGDAAPYGEHCLPWSELFSALADIRATVAINIAYDRKVVQLNGSKLAALA